jgi:predicted secreted acid phosphatase
MTQKLQDRMLLQLWWSGANKKSLSGEMDKMLEAAKVDQNLVSRFGDNLKNFADNVGKMGNLADATVASNDFAVSAKNAATSLNGVKNLSLQLQTA